MFGRRPRGTAGYFAQPARAPARASFTDDDPQTLAARAKNWVKLSLTGATGILAALVMDLQNRGDASALFVVARGLVYAAALVGIVAVPLYVTIGVLMAVGAAVVLYFRPHGLRPAFMTGFGSLAALMTLVPGYSGEAIGVAVQGDPGALPVIEEGNVDVRAEAGPPMRLAGFASQAADPAPVMDGTYEIAVRIAFPDGVPEPVALRIQDGRLKARLYNPLTRKAYNLFLSASEPVLREDDTLLVRASVPADTPEGTLFLRVEAEGYEIDTSEMAAAHGENAVWDVVMRPTSEPLLLQRLKHSYAF